MDGRLPVEEEVIKQPFPHGSPLMLFYPVARPDVTPSGAEDAGLSLLGQAGMVAVRVADLASPAGPGLGRDRRSALVVAGGGEGPRRGAAGRLPAAGGGAALERAGPAPRTRVRDGVRAGVAPDPRASDSGGVRAGALAPCSTGGSRTGAPDPRATRRASGWAGPADDSSPYPQQRDLWLSHAST